MGKEELICFFIFLTSMLILVTLIMILPVIIMRIKCRKAPIVKVKVLEPELIPRGTVVEYNAVQKQNAYRTRLLMEDGTILSKYNDYTQFKVLKEGMEIEIRYKSPEEWSYKKLLHESRFTMQMIMVMFFVVLISFNIVILVATGRL